MLYGDDPAVADVSIGGRGNDEPAAAQQHVGGMMSSEHDTSQEKPAAEPTRRSRCSEVAVPCGICIRDFLHRRDVPSAGSRDQRRGGAHRKRKSVASPMIRALPFACFRMGSGSRTGREANHRESWAGSATLRVEYDLATLRCRAGRAQRPPGYGAADG